MQKDAIDGSSLISVKFYKKDRLRGKLLIPPIERKKERKFIQYTVMLVAQDQHAGGHEEDLHSLKFTGTVGIL